MFYPRAICLTYVHVTRVLNEIDSDIGDVRVEDENRGAISAGAYASA